MTVHLRDETPADHAVIHALTAAAFRTMPYAGGDEQHVIDRLREAGDLTLSLVAEDAGEVVGQVTFSPAQQADGSAPWYALGPVSVLPGRQGDGIGSALIREGIARLERSGALGVILTGNPVYYERFGFTVVPEHCPDGEPAEYFQLLCLADREPTGRFAFHPAFHG